MGLLADTLSESGHEVTWWSSSFNHLERRQRVRADGAFMIHPRCTLRLLHGPSYANPASPRRVANHIVLAKKFRLQAPRQVKPDVMVACLPPIELMSEAVRYANHNGVPIAVDIRDMHPDVAYDLVPTYLRPAMRLALAPAKSTARKALGSANAIFGITDDFVEWGLDLAGRTRNEFDQAYPLATDPGRVSDEEREEACAYWDDRGVERDAFNCVFVGTMSRHLPLHDIVASARALEQERPDIRFIFAGAGPYLDEYKALAEGLSNAQFTGWLGAGQVRVLLERASVGLAPYTRAASFRASYPNKSIEYLSQGLPVLTSLDGRLGALINDRKIGGVYEPGDSQALKSLILGYNDDPEAFARMSQRASKLYQERFEPSAVNNAFRENLERLAQAFRS